MFSMLAFTVPAQAAPVCGNSVVESGEDCDDGNTDPGDCCSPTCQYESGATECRASAGICDVGEFCDGASADCPPDEKLTTVCRPAAHICDAAEFCDGVSDDCPITDLPANGLACPDGDLCNGDEICVGWVCMPGVPLVCDDEDICTADGCDQFLGCVYEPTYCNGHELPSASPAGRLLLSLLVVGAGATFLAWRRRFRA
jgi:cysteine-rich repeat protein